jgi:hypothetical protein
MRSRIVEVSHHAVAMIDLPAARAEDHLVAEAFACRDELGR